jgi:predicted DNA-binding ribbon-helix-helix protein
MPSFRQSARGFTTVATNSNRHAQKSVWGASLVAKRTVVINGRKTSVSIEGPFWNALREIAILGDVSITELASKIDHDRQNANLSSSICLFVLDWYRARDTRLPRVSD